jgi:hypothetical protein
MDSKKEDQEILEEEGEEEVIGPTIEIIIIEKDKKIKKDQTILIGICRMEILEENNMIIVEVTTNRIDLQGTITIINPNGNRNYNNRDQNSIAIRIKEIKTKTKEIKIIKVKINLKKT